jgi:hypothetical protein
MYSKFEESAFSLRLRNEKKSRIWIRIAFGHWSQAEKNYPQKIEIVLDVLFEAFWHEWSKIYENKVKITWFYMSTVHRYREPGPVFQIRDILGSGCGSGSFSYRQ